MIALFWLVDVPEDFQLARLPLDFAVFGALLRLRDSLKTVSWRRRATVLGYNWKPTPCCCTVKTEVSQSIWGLLWRSQSRPATMLWLRSSITGPETVDKTFLEIDLERGG